MSKTKTNILTSQSGIVVTMIMHFEMVNHCGTDRFMRENRCSELGARVFKAIKTKCPDLLEGYKKDFGTKLDPDLISGMFYHWKYSKFGKLVSNRLRGNSPYVNDGLMFYIQEFEDSYNLCKFGTMMDLAQDAINYTKEINKEYRSQLKKRRNK